MDICDVIKCVLVNFFGKKLLNLVFINEEVIVIVYDLILFDIV